MSADILSFIIFLPAIVAIGLMITTRDVNTIRNIAFLTTTVILALVLKLYLEFEPSSGMQFVTNVAWIETYGINYYIGLDGISLTILMMIAILIPTSYLLLWEGKTKGYWINMLLVQTGVTGTLLSLDIVLFYFFRKVSHNLSLHHFDTHGTSRAFDHQHCTSNVVGVQVNHFRIGDFFDLFFGDTAYKATFTRSHRPFILFRRFLDEIGDRRGFHDERERTVFEDCDHHRNRHPCFHLLCFRVESFTEFHNVYPMLPKCRSNGWSWISFPCRYLQFDHGV